MRRFLCPLIPLCAVLTVVSAACAHAQETVDGMLDVSYGPPLATQTTATTTKGIAASNQPNYSTSSELDGGYASVSNGVLYLFLAGNVLFEWNLEGATMWWPLDVFIDCVPGGQNVLLSNNPAPDANYNLNKLSGLTFDAGFTADYWVSVGGNAGSWPKIDAYEGALPTAGGGAGAFLGTELAGGPGALAGGANPFGIQVALVDSNSLGVGSGCGPSSGAGVTAGVEWGIPLAAIGNPSGCIRVCAFISSADHSMLFNQVLGALPPGTCDLGSAASVDFATIPGNQFFSVCPEPTRARTTSWGGLKAAYR